MNPRKILSAFVSTPLNAARDSLSSVRQFAADVLDPRRAAVSSVPEVDAAPGSAEATASFVVRVLAGGWSNC